MKEIVGKTPIAVDQTNEEIMMKFSDGSVGKWYHPQDCCETVVVEEVAGDWDDLLNTPLLVADERESDNEPSLESHDDSNTWTFYTFRSIKGSVDVRWHGSSNGYYSESVYFHLEAA